MKILWHGADGCGWDTRAFSRDVCVVTRQPLLLALAKEGHEITFWKKPTPVSEKDKRDQKVECNSELESEAYEQNAQDADYLDHAIQIADDPYCFGDYDFAVNEVRSHLYFHEKMPEDTRYQYSLWESGLPTLAWDKDLWFAENYHYFKSKYDTGNANVHVITPSLRPQACSSIFASPEPEVSWTHFDFAFDKVVGINPKPPIGFGYLGSEYNREDEFFKYVRTASDHVNTEVFGQFYQKAIDRSPKVKFHGRTPMFRGTKHLNDMRATIHIVPKYYQYCGHMTYRIWETPAAGSVLMADGNIYGIENYVLKENIVHGIDDFVVRLKEIQAMSPSERVYEVAKQRSKLNIEKNTFAKRAEELANIAKSVMNK